MSEDRGARGVLRVAVADAWTVQSWLGRAFDVTLAVVVWLGSPFLGVAEPVAFAVVTLLLAPALEILWRYMRGPLKLLKAKNAALEARVNELQEKLVQEDLPLKVDVNLDTPFLWIVPEPRKDAQEWWIVHAPMKITNQERRTISLDASVTIHSLRGTTVEIPEDDWNIAERPSHCLVTPITLTPDNPTVVGTLGFAFPPFVRWQSGFSDIENLDRTKIQFTFRDRTVPGNLATTVHVNDILCFPAPPEASQSYFRRLIPRIESPE